MSQIIVHTSSDGRTCPLSLTMTLHTVPVKNHQTIKTGDKLIKYNRLYDETWDEF